MRFDLNDEQVAIESSLTEMLSARMTSARLREHVDAGTDDTLLWNELCQNGWMGTATPEEFGGQGLGLLELGLVCEQLGAVLAPVPLLSTSATSLVLQAAGSVEQCERFLRGLGTGRLRGALGVATAGTARFVPDGLGADVTILLDDESGEAWLSGDAAVPVRSVDLTRRVARRTIGEDCTLLPGDPRSGFDRAEVLAAAELTGVARRALELGVSYARERHQFGRPVGSFQGVSHRCVDMLVATESARSLWLYAASIASSGGEELALAASTAKVAAVYAAWTATSGALQILGGIGFTWEHDVHLLLRRARAGRLCWFPVAWHQRRIATLTHEAARRRIALLI